MGGIENPTLDLAENFGLWEASGNPTLDLTENLGFWEASEEPCMEYEYRNDNLAMFSWHSVQHE